MAVDTRSKRASVLGVAAAIVLTLPAPDGAVGQPDQQQAALCYAGIEAGPPVTVLPRRLPTQAASRTRTATPASRTRARIPASEN